MGRTILIQDGMTLAEGLRAIGGYPAAELTRIDELHPEPLDCGAFFSLKR